METLSSKLPIKGILREEGDGPGTSRMGDSQRLELNISTFPSAASSDSLEVNPVQLIWKLPEFTILEGKGAFGQRDLCDRPHLLPFVPFTMVSLDLMSLAATYPPQPAGPSSVSMYKAVTGQRAPQFNLHL